MIFVKNHLESFPDSTPLRVRGNARVIAGLVKIKHEHDDDHHNHIDYYQSWANATWVK